MCCCLVSRKCLETVVLYGKHLNVLSWLTLAHALPPVTIASFQSVWQPYALEAERPKQIWLSHYFQSADSTLGVGKQAAQAIVPSLVPKGLCRNCKRREEIIYIWMRNTLPSAPISPNSIIQEAIKEKCIFLIMTLLVVHLSPYSVIPLKCSQESNFQILSHSWRKFIKWNFLCFVAYSLLPKTLISRFWGWLCCCPFLVEA